MLVAALLVPLLLVIGTVAYFYISTERSSREMTAMAGARELVTSIEGIVSVPIASLRVLASADELAGGNVESVQQRIAAASAALGFPITLFDGGRQVSGASSASLPSEYLDAAGASGRPLIGDRAVDRATGDTGVWVVVPASQGGSILAAWISDKQLEKAFAPLRLENGWIGVVFDRSNRILLRTTDQQALTGQPATTEWVSSATADVGIWFGSNAAGVPSMAAYTHSQATGWTTAVIVPRTLFDAPMWNVVWLVGGIGAVTILIGAGAAYWMASRLSHAIYSLTRSGRALTPDESARAPAIRVREVYNVRKILDAAVAEVHDRENHLRSILDTVPSAMIVIDAHGIILSFSAAAERQFGYTAAEVVGLNVKILMPEPDCSRHDGYIRRYLDTGEARNIGLGRVVTGRRKDGTQFPVELHVGRAEAGGQPLFTGFMRDLTDKHRIEPELRQTQNMEAIGKLTGGVANDFNPRLTFT
jgi:PAS domain S-box-containing protein